MKKSELNKLKALSKKLQKLGEKASKLVDDNWDESAHNDELHQLCHRKMGESKAYAISAYNLDLMIHNLEGSEK